MTEPPGDLQRDLGNMDARLAALERSSELTRLDVREIRDTLAMTKGGWKVLLATAAVAGAIGAMLSQVAWFWPLK